MLSCRCHRRRLSCRVGCGVGCRFFCLSRGLCSRGYLSRLLLCRGLRSRGVFSRRCFSRGLFNCSRFVGRGLSSRCLIVSCRRSGLRSRRSSGGATLLCSLSLSLLVHGPRALQLICQVALLRGRLDLQQCALRLYRLNLSGSFGAGGLHSCRREALSICVRAREGSIRLRFGRTLCREAVVALPLQLTLDVLPLRLLSRELPHKAALLLLKRLRPLQPSQLAFQHLGLDTGKLTLVLVCLLPVCTLLLLERFDPHCGLGFGSLYSHCRLALGNQLRGLHGLFGADLGVSVRTRDSRLRIRLRLLSSPPRHMQRLIRGGSGQAQSLILAGKRVNLVLHLCAVRLPSIVQLLDLTRSLGQTRLQLIDLLEMLLALGA